MTALIERPQGPLDVQWHPDLHKSWGREQLYFVRLGFAPVYQRQQIRTALLNLFAEHRIRSYVGYELLGVYDIMLRLWLPATTTLQAFRESLRRDLKGVNMTTSDSFLVFRQDRNWLWEEDRGGALLPPDEERVEDGPPSPAQLEAISNDPAMFSDFSDANLIRAMPANDGVKFFMLIPSPAYMTDVALDGLYGAVASALDEVPMAEYSLYIGQGFGSGVALIMGRVAFADFYDIGEALGGRVISRLTDTIGVRPYTFPTSSRSFLCYAEMIPGAPGSALAPDPRADVGELLATGETQWVEVKGSAFVPLRPLITEDKLIENPVTDATKGFQRAVVGLLNAGGGTVVLGALEQDRYPADQLSKHFGEYPARGRFLCIGVDHEMNGSRDAFEQRLLSSLASHVVPAPTGHVEVEFAEVEDRTLVLLRVRRSNDTWYYLDGRDFVVRQGNGAIPLDVEAMDRYRAANPRGKERHQ